MNKLALIIFLTVSMGTVVGLPRAGGGAGGMIERAIKASGNVDKLDQFKGVYVKYKGASFIKDACAPCALET